jgi:hypothetical protein
VSEAVKRAQDVLATKGPDRVRALSRVRAVERDPYYWTQRERELAQDVLDLVARVEQVEAERERLREALERGIADVATHAKTVHDGARHRDAWNECRYGGCPSLLATIERMGAALTPEEAPTSTEPSEPQGKEAMNSERLDQLLTQLQETGECHVDGLTLATCLVLANTLGIAAEDLEVHDDKLVNFTRTNREEHVRP